MNQAHTTHHPHDNGNSPAASSELLVTGMNCNNCARHVTEAIQSVRGVHSATVVLDTGRASVRWSAGSQAHLPEVLSAIKAAGYEVKPVEAAHDHEGHEHSHPSGWTLNLWIGVLVTVPLMIGEWVFGLGTERWFQWTSFLLAGVVQVFAGAQFYLGAWRQLKVNRANMDTLVALGSTTAFGYSVWAFFTGMGGHLYFMEAAAIITLISVGHWFEARVSTRAASALKSLLNLAPRTARLRDRNGAETEVPVAQLKIDDIVTLRPGDHVPTDGEIVEGNSAVDEAMLTGESAPIDKVPGSKLYAGTVNMNGKLAMRITATGESTALAHIIAAVQRAQTSRADIQRLGDRVANVFVLAVIGVAAATLLWWAFLPERAYAFHDWLSQVLWATHLPDNAVAMAFMAAAAVLIVACPCAMGLATPAAIMAAANAAAQRGILIRDGVALEKAGEITAVIFDKTGTLTIGKPDVAMTFSPIEGSNPSPLASALARHSTHPLSLAIAKLSSDEVPLNEWQEIRGSGVQAITADKHISRLGSLSWLRQNSVDLAPGESFIAEWSTKGATIIGLSVDDALHGLFAIKDTLKPGAAKVVEQLKKQGLKAYLLTGDNLRTATSLAQQIGIAADNVFAEVRPEQKAEFVKKLQQKGERVAFVGDGIDDAPALEQADLGIAVSRASDVAREAADIILLKSEIEAVPEALGLARATLRTIKQNLFWAFFYNAVGVPLAALGFMSPILCAAAMGFSDIIVIGNALRLRRWRMRS